MPDPRPHTIKRLLRQTLDFTLYSNFFIAVCSVGQALLTYRLLELDPEYPVLGILFFSTLAMYNFAMLISKPENYKKSPYRRVRWIYSHYRLMITMSMIAIISIAALSLFLSLSSILLMGFTGFVAICYNLPLFKFNDRKFGLRNIPGLKLFLISLIWSLSTVIFPIVESATKFHAIVLPSDAVLLAGMSFLFISAITIPFDVRDIFQDRLYSLQTLPVVLGARKSIAVAHLMLFAYIGLLFVFSKGTIGPAVAALLIAQLITAFFIHRSASGKSEYFYFLFLDGTMLLQVILVITAQWLYSLL